MSKKENNSNQEMMDEVRDLVDRIQNECRLIIEMLENREKGGER